MDLVSELPLEFEDRRYCEFEFAGEFFGVRTAGTDVEGFELGLVAVMGSQVVPVVTNQCLQGFRCGFGLCRGRAMVVCYFSIFAKSGGTPPQPAAETAALRSKRWRIVSFARGCKA